MKKLILVLLFLPLISFGQKIKGKKLFSIKAGVGEWQSSVGEYLNLKTIYAPYTKGVFDGIAKGIFDDIIIRSRVTLTTTARPNAT